MNKKVILCVDDEPMILESLEIQLRAHFGDRFLYESAESAKEAIEVIEDLVGNGLRLLVIVSDWLMPGVRGDEFLIEVNERFPGIIKVLLTGQADDAAIQRAWEVAQIHRCLAKPWSPEELFETIQSGLTLLEEKE
ncbi:MAG: response regulator [Ignavibacteria bacterium]|jgi:CheY-like chemotaxis protein|nr:response regulator [Ignavibacteria bacterium]